MANEEADSDIEEYSSMEQPPLIKQLKNILAEYPDDGQIIKELLQNAEDAGASEVKILYDDRCINTQEDSKSKYRKFLKGPALCFFNDATFTESDWKGIKMMYSSVKEEDPLKVGRFGLGFKSVFHITDHPVVLSSDRILFMDPHRNADCVCLTIQLSKLQKWKKFNIEDFYLALDGTFGVSRETLEKGMYNGTLLWFPLRSKASNLSDTVYNREKVMDLFTSFRTEASSILVFLKHLTKVSLHERKSHTNMINMQFNVEIVKNVDEVRELRKEFLTKIKSLNKSISHNSIDCRYCLTFCTKSFNGDSVMEEINNNWMVVNYYKGGSMSEELRALIQDDSLGYCPLVGVAAPIGQNHAEFKGHVYCFLPLPQKAKSMSGLPVHVNGFFALSQNRRHIKWPSAEQDAMHLHMDKSLVWNEKLLKEVLPDAYEILISEMINHAVKKGNPDDIVQCVYETIPRVDKVVDEWNAILPSLFGRSILGPTLMTVNTSGEKSWISCSEAFFATFCQYTNLPPTVKTTLVKILRMYKKQYVDVPLHVFEFFFKFNSCLTDMCPQSFAAMLKENPWYKPLSWEEKLIVLQFLTLDCCYEILEGLELLPLQDGSFVTFVSRCKASDQVFLCNKDEKGLFPGLEKKFVYQADQNHWLEKHMQAIVKQGLYQIQLMDAATFPVVLETVIQEQLGPTCPPTVRPFSILTGSWIQKVWEHIFSHKYDVRHFQHMPLIPLLKSGSWSDIQEMELYQLTDFLIVKQIQNVSSLNEDVYRCLELLSIKVLPLLPEWLQRSQILQYIHSSTVNEVIQLLDKLYLSVHRKKLISDFNRSCEEGLKKEFVCFLAGSTSWTSNSKNFVRCLKLFMESGSGSRTVSVQENTAFSTVANFPVKFPRPIIIGSYDECRLAIALGATELDRKSLIKETLQTMQGTTYSFSEKQTFMQYFIQNIREFEGDKSMLKMASSVSFLESNIKHAFCTPSDLFDPMDSRLRKLFDGENRFPVENCFETNTDIVALKMLGLKKYNDLSAIELYETAQLIESWCENENARHLVPAKADQFLEVLNEKPSHLNAYVHGNTLKVKLMNMKCMPHAKSKDRSFPSVLPWFQQQDTSSRPSELRLIKFSTLVGSTMPLIDCQSKELSEAFGWNKDPPQDKVLEQLRLLINVYEISYKPELLPVLKEIYQELNKYSIHKLLVDKVFQTLVQDGCIWRGDGFSSPHKIFLDSKRNDLDLSPYLYKLPEEFKRLHSFFLGLDCNKEQNVDVFLKIQVLIKEKYTSGKHSNDDVKRDLSILISILNRLRMEKSKLQDQLHKILFPIHCGNESTLILKPGPECTYCNAQWLRDMTSEDEEEDIYYVHEDVSNMTAEELGVKSLTQQLLSDTEELAIEEWGQQESLTTRLHRLLKEGYQDGFSVPKEIVQNADDAGAKSVYFLYDERENEDAKINLLDEGMAECQGAAFWAYNDAQFQEKDFRNIIKLNGATKKDELEKIGKFGLGFCSVYNLTDVPSFISGSNIVILDPHKSHLGKALPGSSPGMRIDFGKMKNLKMMKRLKNQFKPFQNVFGCNTSCNFQGTLFRFPLRTASQAQRSEISNKYYSKEECQELLNMTIQAAGNLLLFTQHIQEIKIFHLPADSKDPKEAKVLFSITKEHFQGQSQDSNEETILSQVSKLKSASDLRSHPLKRLQKIAIKEKIEQYAGAILPSLAKQAGMSASASWLISWATGTHQSVKQVFRDVVGALPLGAVAVPFEMRVNQFCPVQLKDLPFGFYKNGHLFCFLPLPILCDLPVHINGCFSVTSDRRQLMTSTEDDKKHQRSSWNQALIQDALVNAYIYLLEGIREHGPSPEYEYYSLWPLKCQNTELPIRKHFLKKLVQLNSRLFHRDVHWEGFDKCIFLDPALRNDKSIGDAVFETLLTFYSGVSSVVMELPYHVMENLKVFYPDKLKERIVSEEQFFLNVFLPNIEKDFWSQSQTNINKRDKLVIHSLRNEHEAVKEALSSTRCIPSEPNGALKRPIELVNPLGKLSDMFSDNDEVFPRGKETFRQKRITELLVGLGMMDNYLPFDFLQDRCQSVLKLAQTCGQCTIERCSKILIYLSQHNVQMELENNQNDLQTLRNITFLPVLQKPSHWQFSWKGSTIKHTITDTCHRGHTSKTIRLASPANLFAQGTEKLVGCVELVLDERSIAVAESSIQLLDVYKLLRVQGSKKSDVPYETVFRQLKTVAQEYKQNQSKDTIKHCQAIMHEIYSFLDKQCENSEEMRTACFRDLSNEDIILLADQIIDASRIAFHLKHNCSPVLHSLANTDLAKYKHLWKAIGVKEHFDIEDIVRVLGDKKRQLGPIPLSAEDIDLVHELLSALNSVMIHKGIKYTDIDKSLLVNIVAPDMDGILRETSTLCLDDSEFETGPDTKTVHHTISPSLAVALDVKTKRRKCFDDFSCLIPGGQKEKLVTRLRGIMSAYPCDDGIIKELLQNADDAQASEIHFIKDFRTHGCKKIFDQRYEPLQGPALCVFNNSAFTQADIQGIHDLGLGSKREDPLKTGQYGVGFNAVYHLTDAPSFLTKGPELEHGEMLCVFDPTCQYLPKVDEQNPGVQCLVDKIRNNYPDVLTGYLEENFFTANVGTMFRFPLKNKKTPNTTHISAKQVDEEEVSKTLEKFCDENFDALLFVKHVSKITVSNISSGELIEEYRVEVTMSEEDRRRRNDFFQFVRKVSSQYKQDRTSIINMSSKEVGYTMTVTDGKWRSKSFYVVQRIGFKEGFRLPETVVDALKENNLGQLPLSGVAVVIPNIEVLNQEDEKKKDHYKIEHIRPTSEHGRAFCFLPLPLKTGLPCHINGHFVLDHEARRSLWKDDKGYRHDWNHSLFQAIISPAYISALLFLKQQIFGGKREWSNHIIHRLLDAFHSQFPLMYLAKDDDWKAIVQYLHHLMIEDEVEVFPVMQESMHDSRSVSSFKETLLDWVALQKSENLFPAYFHELSPGLAGILKGLGMKLVDSPLEIKKSIQDSGIQVQEVSPDAVAKFLKSHHSTEKDRCSLEINVPISSTRLGTADNVQTVIQYLEKMPNFSEEVDQLPLLLTNDEVLRLFLSNQPVIISHFWDLFQCSSHHFLHHKLVFTCQSEKFRNSGVLCELTVHKLEELLPSTVSPQLYKDGKDLLCSKLSDSIPNQFWIVRFWEFQYERSVRYSDYGLPNIDHNALKKNLKMLEQWSFLPVKQNDKDTLLLRPINQGFTIVDLYSFEVKSDLRSALEGLNLPRIDTRIFSECQCGHLTGMLYSLVASYRKPLKLLNCLYYHKEKIRNASLTIQQCNSFLVFFSRHMEELKKEKGVEEWWIQDRIKALPLHITQQGTATSLDGNKEVLVIPTGMPTGGIGEWATNTGHILLRQNSELDELHKLLGCTNSCTIDIYCDKILRRFDALPKCHHIEHLAYIKDSLLQGSYLYMAFSDEQTKLIQVLKSTAFISTDDGMKYASEFYDPFHSVFSHMCDEGDFPSAPFDALFWNSFMKLVGLKTEVKDEKFVEFAEKLAKEGALCVTKAIEDKCKVLIEFLFDSDTSTFRKNTCERLARIKFIPAHVASEELLSICRQYSDCTSLICFSGSISASFERLCWTSIPLLPVWTCTETEGWRHLSPKLGVYSKPPIERVVSHCQNICDTQKKTLSGKDQNVLNIEFLKIILERVYAYLFQHKDTYPEMIKRLKHTPVIFIPENCILLPVRNIVIDLVEEDAVEPYLCRAPSYYGKYHDLFIYLGAAKKVTCNHYFMILEAIYQQQQEPNKKLLPNEVIIVKKAIENLVKLLTRMTDKQKDINVGTLYLPNRELILKDARKLIVSDLKSAEERLSECNLDFFIGFMKLKIDVLDPRPIVKAFPECCRPRLLSEIAKEEIGMSDITELESKHADSIEQFLHSTDFLYGIFRLVKHMKTEMNRPFTKDEEEKIYAEVQSLRVREVSGLYTYLIVDGKRIQSSKETETWFIQPETIENTVHYTMYFQSDGENDMNDYNFFYMVQPGIITMIRKCIEHLLEMRMTKTTELYDMLNCYKRNRSIDKILDKHHIDLYDRPQSLLHSVFPPPGTYVPKEFHAFLEQGFSDFQKYEYDSLAYELEDDIGASDNAEPVYIYVHIIRPLKSAELCIFGLKQQYLIDIGFPEYITVSGYTLFKFERKQDSTLQDLLPSDNVPVGSLPFDDTCRQIMNILLEAWSLPPEERHRILRRLMLRWHPDRNIGQEHYCTRVFMYIGEVVSRLDSGQSLDDINISGNNLETRNVFTGTVYENLGRRVNRRSEQYNQQHSEQQHTFYQAHSRKHRGGRGSRPNLPAPDQPNARRWILQAKKDLVSAKVFHPLAENVPAFNWICYHCQQGMGNWGHKKSPVGHTPPAWCEMNVYTQTVVHFAVFVLMKFGTLPRVAVLIMGGRKTLPHHLHDPRAKRKRKGSLHGLMMELDWATEKALKAAVYAKDANSVDLKSRQLANIATKGGLSQDLVQLAMNLQSCLGQHTRMRYPDSIARTQIPSELYTDVQARIALEIAEKVVQLVDENYLN